METILIGRCSKCNNVAAVGRKVKGLKRSDWEGMAMEFLDGGLIVNLSNEMPEITGCVKDCK